MNLPCVSWHCVTFDRPDILPDLVDCFRKQTYPTECRELIIVNDQENITYICEDKNICVFNFKERFKSLGAKRNFAMDQCNGEFIFITDDDEIYLPQHTEHLVNLHMKTDADIVRDRYCFHTNEQTHLDKVWGFPQCSIKRSFAEKNKFNEIFNAGEDVDYIKKSKFKIIDNDPDKSTSIFRWNPDIYHATCNDPEIFTNKDKQQELFENTIRHQRYKEKLDVIL